MWSYSLLTLAILINSQINLLHAAATAVGSELSLHMCNNNETIAVQVITQPSGKGLTCQCQAGPTPDPTLREDYIHTPGIGSHKLHVNAKNWNDARKVCIEENAHLAIINSRAEEQLLVDMLNRAVHQIKYALNTEEALLGIHDLYKEGEWVTIFGESLYTTGYSHWSPTYFGGQPDNFQGGQNCGAIISQSGMDDVFCHDKFAFFCEMPLNC